MIGAVVGSPCLIMYPDARWKLSAQFFRIWEKVAESLELRSAITHGRIRPGFRRIRQRSEFNYKEYCSWLVVNKVSSLNVLREDSHLEVFTGESNWWHQEYFWVIRDAETCLWEVLIRFIKSEIFKSNIYLYRAPYNMLKDWLILFVIPRQNLNFYCHILTKFQNLVLKSIKAVFKMLNIKILHNGCEKVSLTGTSIVPLHAPLML